MRTLVMMVIAVALLGEVAHANINNQQPWSPNVAGNPGNLFVNARAANAPIANPGPNIGGLPSWVFASPNSPSTSAPRSGQAAPSSGACGIFPWLCHGSNPPPSSGPNVAPPPTTVAPPPPPPSFCQQNPWMCAGSTPPPAASATTTRHICQQYPWMCPGQTAAPPPTNLAIAPSTAVPPTVNSLCAIIPWMCPSQTQSPQPTTTTPPPQAPGGAAWNPWCWMSPGMCSSPVATPTPSTAAPPPPTKLGDNPLCAFSPMFCPEGNPPSAAAPNTGGASPSGIQASSAHVRYYYVAVKEIDWDYAPLGNQVHSRLDSFAAKYLDPSDPNSFGKVFKKAVYREYTDDTFTQEKPQPSHLGLLGPTIRGNVGEVMRIKFRNMATRPYTIHPHGAAYVKKHEGALYTDGTSGDDKLDDMVHPDETITLDWLLSKEHRGAPATGDPNCLPWTYHSHLNPIADVQSGLMGILLICKAGTLDEDNVRRDVDKEFILLSHIIDESMSWYYQENVARFAPHADQNSPSFATKFHTINGYIYGNVPGLEACSGDRVAWHMIGLGNEDDLHPLTINGHVLEYNHHRTDIIALFAAKFSAAYMTAGDVGKWIIKCQTADHHFEGEQAFLHVNPSCGKPPPYESLNGQTRNYFIAAVEKRWSYDGGSGLNGYERGLAFLNDPSQESSKYFTTNAHRIGGTYWKIVYEEYTDDTFMTVKPRPLSKHHYGLLGPEIAAQIGDTIKVVFKNLAPSSGRRFSIHPRGVKYDKQNEGEDYNDGTADGGVGHLQTRTYTWTVPNSYAPGQADSECITYMYHSAIDPVRDVFSGLIGPLVVCNQGGLARRGNEFTLLFANFNENLSWLLDKNILEFASPAAPSSPGFEESNIMSSINGYSYGNLPKPTMCLGDEVTWRLLAVGNVIDMHIPTFSGNTFTRFDGNTRDSVSLFPGTTETISMTTVNKGTWSLMDASDDNNVAGMVALYKVDQCNFFFTPPLDSSGSGITHTYYIAAVERMWEFAPWKFDLIVGGSITDPSNMMYTFARPDWPFLGTQYKKALYREYTDATFSVEKTRSPEEEHLGIMGPFIKAEVTDTIKVVFKNMASRPYSIHPNLVMYSKTDEGYAYKDDVNEAAGVPPWVGIKTYTWEVPKSSGPGKNDPNCITSAYRSAVNLEKDFASGLVGPMAICKKGTLSGNKRRDVEKEIATLWTIFDENDSWYLDENIMNHPQYPGYMPDKTDAEFQESNRFHVINGHITAKDSGFNMKECDLVAWYFISFGGRADIHTVHFHAQSYIWNTEGAHRGDTLEVFPGIFEVATMLADDPGLWLMHCHVDDHVGAGMITQFFVEKSADPVQCSMVHDANK